MTKIRARCPRCGDVEFGVANIVVLTDDASAGACSAYRFDCPECGDQVSRSAVPDVLALLLSAGVREVAPQTQDPQITEVDVESFRRLLDSEFVWDRLQSAINRED